MKKNITIGIDARMWGDKQTGIGRYVSSLSEEFFKQAPENNFVLFMRDIKYLDKYAHYKNIRSVKVNERWYSFGEQITLPAHFLNKNLDVLFVPHFNVPLIWRGKFVTTIHDVTPLFFPGHLQKASSIRSRAFRTVFSSALKRAQHIIAVSSYTRDQVIKNFGRSSSDKISVIYEGISDLNDKNITENILLAHRIKSGITKPFIFFVGVWRPHKNITGLLEAFALIKKRFGDKYLLVLGGEEDPRYPEIRSTWERLGLENDIVRPGFIPDNELPLWYKTSAAVVIPSFVEGFGLVGLEAIKYGSFVAASSGGATPEVLKGAAAYFDPQDPANMAQVIAGVLQSEEEQVRQKEEADKVISLYSWEKSAAQTLNILRKAANGQ